MVDKINSILDQFESNHTGKPDRNTLKVKHADENNNIYTLRFNVHGEKNKKTTIKALPDPNTGSWKIIKLA